MNWHYGFQQYEIVGRGSSVGYASAWHADGRGFDHRARQHSVVEIGHEHLSTASLSLPLVYNESHSTTTLFKTIGQES